MKITVLNQEIKRFKNQTVAFLEVALTNNGVILESTTIKGIAKCCPEDKYDFNIGRKIALARAEIKVYEYYRKIAINLNDMHQNIAISCANLYDKLRKQIKHNKEYIEDIISGNTEIDDGCSAL